MNSPTIEDLIKILSAAKKSFGPDMPVKIYNRSGDPIYPDTLDEISILRGNDIWEELVFVEQ